MRSSSHRAWLCALSALGSLISAVAVPTPTPKPVVITVSDVALAEKPLAARPAVEAMRAGAGDEVEAFSPVGDEEWVAGMSSFGHPFIHAAHLAFNDHRPLAISPDMIWQLLVQMAADEVNENPHRYRELFAIHERGGRTLCAQRDGFRLGNPDNDWPGVFAELEAQIVKNVPGSPAAEFSHKFSTSTPVHTAARQVVLLAAASPFYNFHVHSWCGIPRIELHGAVNDWCWIRSKAGSLSQFNMERRVKALLPVLDEFVAAAEGKADSAIWKSFYKFTSESGGSYVSGWINLFFVPENDMILNEVLDSKFQWSQLPAAHRRSRLEILPLAMRLTTYKGNGVINVDFVWTHYGTSMPMRIRAGFMGVAQDRKSLALKPAIAWQVLRGKQSTDERQAMDFLGALINIDWLEMLALKRDFVFDPETGIIRVERNERSRSIDSRFWRKAFPLMHRLEMIDTGRLLSGVDAPEERQALCEAMLSAPAVTTVRVSGKLDEECLRILKGRTDWKIETVKK